MRNVEDDPYYRIVVSHPIPDRLIKKLQKAQFIEDETYLHTAKMQPIPLSDKERSVLLAMGDGGFTRQEAADALGMSVETVKEHLRSARFKMGARNTTHAIVRAVRAGII